MTDKEKDLAGPGIGVGEIFRRGEDSRAEPPEDQEQDGAADFSPQIHTDLLTWENLPMGLSWFLTEQQAVCKEKGVR